MTPANAQQPGFFTSLLDSLSKAIRMSQNAEILRQKLIQYNTMSDSELAKHNLKREDITSHVFKDFL